MSDKLGNCYEHIWSHGWRGSGRRQDVIWGGRRWVRENGTVRVWFLRKRPGGNYHVSPRKTIFHGCLSRSLLPSKELPASWEARFVLGMALWLWKCPPAKEIVGVPQIWWSSCPVETSCQPEKSWEGLQLLAGWPWTNLGLASAAEEATGQECPHLQACGQSPPTPQSFRVVERAQLKLHWFADPSSPSWVLIPEMPQLPLPSLGLQISREAYSCCCCCFNSILILFYKDSISYFGFVITRFDMKGWQSFRL